MSRTRRARNRQHDDRTSQEPCERDLRRRHALPFRDPCDCALLINQPQQSSVVAEALVADRSGLQRTPWNERDLLPLAVVDERLPLPIREIVTILDRNDREELARALNLLDVDLRESDMPDLAFTPGALQKAKLLILGYRRIDAMELTEIDSLETHSASFRRARPEGARDDSSFPIGRGQDGRSRLWSRSEAVPGTGAVHRRSMLR
jgi:hypothetical protein